MPLDFHPLKSDFAWELVYTTIGLLYLSKNVYLFHYHFGKSFTLPFETMPTTLPITYCFLFRTFLKICSGWRPKQLEPEFDTPHPQPEQGTAAGSSCPRQDEGTAAGSSCPQQDEGTAAGPAAGSSSLRPAGPETDLGKGANILATARHYAYTLK